MEATVLQCLALHIRQRHARSSAGVSAIACELNVSRAFPKKWVLEQKQKHRDPIARVSSQVQVMHADVYWILDLSSQIQVITLFE